MTAVTIAFLHKPMKHSHARVMRAVSHALCRPLYASVWVLYVCLCMKHALRSAVRPRANSNMRTTTLITHNSRVNEPKMRKMRPRVHLRMLN